MVKIYHNKRAPHTPTAYTREYPSPPSQKVSLPSQRTKSSRWLDLKMQQNLKPSCWKTDYSVNLYGWGKISLSVSSCAYKTLRALSWHLRCFEKCLTIQLLRFIISNLKAFFSFNQYQELQNLCKHMLYFPSTCYRITPANIQLSRFK